MFHCVAQVHGKCWPSCLESLSCRAELLSFFPSRKKTNLWAGHCKTWIKSWRPRDEHVKLHNFQFSCEKRSLSLTYACAIETRLPPVMAKPMQVQIQTFLVHMAKSWFLAGSPTCFSNIHGQIGTRHEKTKWQLWGSNPHACGLAPEASALDYRQQPAWTFSH